LANVFIGGAKARLHQMTPPHNVRLDRPDRLGYTTGMARAPVDQDPDIGGGYPIPNKSAAMLLLLLSDWE